MKSRIKDSKTVSSQQMGTIERWNQWFPFWNKIVFICSSSKVKYCRKNICRNRKSHAFILHSHKIWKIVQRGKTAKSSFVCKIEFSIDVDILKKKSVWQTVCPVSLFCHSFPFTMQSFVRARFATMITS